MCFFLSREHIEKLKIILNSVIMPCNFPLLQIFFVGLARNAVQYLISEAEKKKKNVFCLTYRLYLDKCWSITKTCQCNIQRFLKL